MLQKIKEKLVNWLLRGVVVEEIKTKKLVDKGNTLYVDIADFDHNASDPGSPTESQMWYNSTDHVLRYRNNVETIDVGGDGLLNVKQDFLRAVGEPTSGDYALYAGTGDPDWNDCLKETIVASKSGTLTADIEGVFRSNVATRTAIVRTLKGAVQEGYASTTSTSYTSCDTSFTDDVVIDETYEIKLQIRGDPESPYTYNTAYGMENPASWKWDFSIA